MTTEASDSTAKNAVSNELKESLEQSPTSVTAATSKESKSAEALQSNLDSSELDSRKRSPDNDDDKDNKRTRIDLNLPVVDVAEDLGYKTGDRFEVQWMLDCDDGSGEEKVWWGATLLESDGRTLQAEDEIRAVRVLEYDALPERGYPEKSREDVVFGNEQILFPSGFEQDSSFLEYRKEGTEGVVALDDEGLRNMLNSMLENVMSKNGSLWKTLTPAQQASVAEKVANGKELLLTAIKNHSPGQSITAEDVPTIFANAFRDMI